MNSATLFEQALEAFRRNDAMQARRLAEAATIESPDDPRGHQLAGTAALVGGDIDAAIGFFKAAIRATKRPDEAALGWTGLGRCHLNREHSEPAEQAFRRALSLSPQLPPAHAGLAYALVAQGRYPEAEASARRAIALGEQRADVHNTLARSLIAQDKLDEAEAALAQALAIEPQSPDARFLRGNLAKVRGNMSEAEEIYRHVLKNEPNFPGWGQVAQMKTFRERDSDVEKMEAQLAASKDAPPSTRVEVLFALAKVYDDLGDADRAFAYLQEGNALQDSLYAYDPTGDESRLTRIESLFTSEFIHAFPEGGQTGVQPIFIASMPRSGSTLMEQMLASHPQVRGGGELDHFARVATGLSLKWGAEPAFPNLDPAMAAADLREAGKRYADLTTSLRLICPRFTDKSLTNFQYVGLIRMMLPDARVVHIRRHPLATGFGLYRQRFAFGLGYAYSFEKIAQYYRAYARLMLHWRHACPEVVTEVFYEALIQDPKRELARILEDLDLPFNPAVLEFYRTERPVRTASLVQVREPLSTRGLERHKAYEGHLEPLRALLQPEIQRYEKELEEALAHGGTTGS